MISAALMGLAACTTVVGARPLERGPHVEIRAMPAPIVEVRPAAPGPGYAWVQGHWEWHRHDWRWVPGVWVAGPVQPMPPVVVEQVPPPMPGRYWVPGHWRWAHGGWIWVRGHWG